MKKFSLTIYAGLIGLVALFCAFETEAKTLRIAIGLSIPPYVIEHENRGIEYDILKEILESQGYEMEPVFVPLGRTLHLLKHGKVDGSMSTGLKGLPGCYTDPHITYWNFAISLKSEKLEINSVQDLRHKRVISFQNAKNYLGAEFHEMAKVNKRYTEIADQSIQSKLLFLRRVDVVVADRFIFEWYRKDPEVKKFVDTSQGVVHHRLFEPSSFSAVFKSDEVCLAFNKGLKQMKASGRYEEIIASYNVAEPILAN